MRTLSRIGEENSERAVVLVTHRLEEIPAGFDHIAIMGRKPIPAEDATEAGVDSMGNPGAGTIVYTGSLENGLDRRTLVGNCSVCPSKSSTPTAAGPPTPCDACRFLGGIFFAPSGGAVSVS